jgi:hypothetical protein
MTTDKLTLDLLPDELAICRLPVDAAVPNWVWRGGLTSITSSDGELSVVCGAEPVPPETTHTAGWRALKVRGPLDFSLVGILAGISGALADAGVSIFAISTYDTDYVLVKAEQLAEAVSALESTGYRVVPGDAD